MRLVEKSTFRCGDISLTKYTCLYARMTIPHKQYRKNHDNEKKNSKEAA